MIRLERPDAPPSLAKEWRSEKTRAAKFYDALPEKRSHRRFTFKAAAESRAARDSLLGMTQMKCAMCEKPVETNEPGLVECFRPPWGSTDATGRVHPDHYWWLAGEWDNLFPVCAECKRHRGKRFPLAPGARRASPHRIEPRTVTLLIDPVHEDPGDHLIFCEDGKIVPRNGSSKGEATIETWGLNRTSLVERRAAYAGGLLEALHRWKSDVLYPRKPMTADRLKRYAAKVRDELGNYLSHEFPFVAFGRVLIAPWVADLPPKFRGALFPKRRKVNWWFEPIFESRWIDSKANAAMAVKRFAKQTQRSDFVRKSQWISRIEIDDFKGIQHLELSISEESLATDHWPWLVLLGENSTGKSSVLEAVGLALGGSDYANDLGLDADIFVRRLPEGSRGKRPRSGRVKIGFAGTDREIELTFRRGSSSFKSSADDEVPLMVMGYGSVRMLPRGKTAPERDQGRPIRVQNLFDPSVPLNDPATWLARTNVVKLEEFGRVSHSLRPLFPGAGEEWLDRSKGELTADVGSVRVPLLSLSAGYQSTLAMALDIYKGFRRHFRAMEIAEGVVLIDELGEHLHPRWKKRIVNDLRNLLPRVQFIATTHDPLCLRGVKGKEVVLMRRTNKGKVYAITDLPPVENMRVDQILTSEFFGLDGAYEESMEHLLTEYYELLAKHTWNPKQAARLQQLRGEVHEREVLGTTQRERMLVDAIDGYLARERNASEPEERSRLRSTLDTEIEAALARSD